MKLLLSCEHVAELISEYQDGELPRLLAVRVRLHLHTCRACQAMAATLRVVPGLVRRALELPQGEAMAQGRAALEAVRSRLGLVPRVAPLRPLPEALAGIPADQRDLPLQVMVLAHQSMDSVLPRESSPWLPQEVMDLLPSSESWRWTRRGGLRSAELLRDAGRGIRLSLLEVPAGYRIPRHRHQGSESLLILAGGMTDELGSYEPGDWHHMANDTLHSPVMSAEGCICLVREEGHQTFVGPFAWVRNLLAA